MEIVEINTRKVCELLNEIMEYELAGVVRYTHSSLMVTGPYRIPIVTFLKEQATESMVHAQQAGRAVGHRPARPRARLLPPAVQERQAVRREAHPEQQGDPLEDHGLRQNSSC